MPYIIQDMDTGAWLKHKTGHGDDHPFEDVFDQTVAERYVGFEHVCYVAFWYTDKDRKWRIVDVESEETFVHAGGGKFVREDRSAVFEPEEPDSLTPAKRFRWTDRLACVEALSLETADNGGRYAAALRTIRLRDYCRNASRMPQRQHASLKRDVNKMVKDILHMRESADVGDIVKIQKLVPSVLPGSAIRDGRKLVEAEVISKVRVASSFRYQVRRLDDQAIQTGNGHLIKSIVRKNDSMKGDLYDEKTTSSAAYPRRTATRS
ncbi:hypothetical protein [Cohnella nanjingensis]|uniref:Uncharacterized protein n=1 Tax=Cohnella nanjingensis TaxID=1387779 RepID=A0A7X0RSX8_9BACL|nr:hypothetical protein [Cohnella nanjingensis]MBB6672995.1 hypothetical protein [Cohnella nanjingensis]